MWVHHHMIFRLVRCVDVTLLFANGFLLMLVTVVPFPTAVVAEYLRTPAAAGGLHLLRGLLRADQHRLLGAVVGGVSQSRPRSRTPAPRRSTVCGRATGWGRRCIWRPPSPDPSVPGWPWEFAARCGSCGPRLRESADRLRARPSAAGSGRSTAWSASPARRSARAACAGCAQST